MQMHRQIPTAEELHAQTIALLRDIDPADRDVWFQNPCTMAVFRLLEASRLQAIEMMEDGATGERLTQLMAQAGLARSLAEDMQEYIAPTPVEDEDDEPTEEVPTYDH